MARKRNNATPRPSVLNRVVWEAFGDLVDPQEYLRDEPGGYRYAYTDIYSDRTGGRNGQTIRDEQDLTNIRGAARAICDVSVHAKAALNNLSNYTLGRGLIYRAQRKSDGPRDWNAPPDEEVQAVQAVIDDFLVRTRWGETSRRKAMFRRHRRDGELILHLTPIGSGRCDLRSLEPGLLTEPQDSAKRDDAEYTFGVLTDPTDLETILGYHVRWSERESEVLAPERVCHWKLNVDPNVKRGLSDFYPVEVLLTRASKLLRNTAGGAAVLAAIAAIIEHPPGVAAGAVESFRAGARYNQQDESTPKGTRQRYSQKYNEASFIHVPQGQKYQPSPLAGQGVGAAMVTIEQAVLRAVACNWSMPEYMISGDASNNNYASILEAGSPFKVFINGLQGDVADEERELLWKVLLIACEGGQIKTPFERLRREIELTVEAPQAGLTMKTEDTTRRQVLHDAGILSARTWAAQEDLDFEQEQGNGAKRAATSDTAPQNPLPTPAKPREKQTAVVATSGDAGVKTELTLNGAQVSSAIELLSQIVAGTLAEEAALELLVGIGIPRDRALSMIATQGRITKVAAPTQPAQKLAESVAALWGDYPAGGHGHA